MSRWRNTISNCESFVRQILASTDNFWLVYWLIVYRLIRYEVFCLCLSCLAEKGHPAFKDDRWCNIYLSIDSFRNVNIYKLLYVINIFIIILLFKIYLLPASLIICIVTNFRKVTIKSYINDHINEYIYINPCG